YPERQCAHGAGVHPLAPGGRESGGRGFGARAPGAPRRCAGRACAAGAGARRCGLRRPGVVMETLQLSQARGFFTGGTINIIINNQVGFTTSDVRDARSTLYSSDVAKMLEVPIFHVNADDAEAVVFVTRLALKYRMRFRKDVVI